LRKFFLLILGLFILLIPAREIYAQRALAIAETLNVRSGPGTKHEVIDKLKKGDSYLIDKIEGQWVQLAWPIEAWVYKGLVKIEEQQADLEQLQIDFQNWLLDKYYRVMSIEFKNATVSSNWASHSIRELLCPLVDILMIGSATQYEHLKLQVR